jgi:hypothetical protein
MKPINQTVINGEKQQLKCWVVDVLTTKQLIFMQDLRFSNSGDKDQNLLGCDTDSTVKLLPTRCQNLRPLSSGTKQSKIS